MSDKGVVAGGFLENLRGRTTGIAVVFDSGSGADIHREDFVGTADFGSNSVAMVAVRGNEVSVGGVITNTDTFEDMFGARFKITDDRSVATLGQ